MPCADTTQYAGHTAQFRGLSPEDSQVGCAGSCLRDVPEATSESDRRGQQHASAQQTADPPIHLLVGQIFPRSPFTIISTAIRPTTMANTRRSTRVLAPVNTRAPNSDPVNTPNMTGIASSGSI